MRYESMWNMKSTTAVVKPRTWGRLAMGSAAISISALALTACGGDGGDQSGNQGSTNAGPAEWVGTFTVNNADSEFYLGGGPHRGRDITVKCSKEDGLITATLTGTATGNVFTTTQPASGRGYSGGELTMGNGDKYTWVPIDGVTQEQLLTNEPSFKGGKTQDGTPALWAEDGSLDLGSGMAELTTKTEEGMVKVSTPGTIDCTGS